MYFKQTVIIRASKPKNAMYLTAAARVDIDKLESWKGINNFPDYILQFQR